MTSPIQKCCSWFSCCWVEVEKDPPRMLGYGTFLGPVEPETNQLNDLAEAPKPKAPDDEFEDISLKD